MTELSLHADATHRCPGPETEHDCGTTLTAPTDAQPQRHLTGTDADGTPLRSRFEMTALQWTCPDCGTTSYTCPNCAEADGPPGWLGTFACHNCNSHHYKAEAPPSRSAGLPMRDRKHKRVGWGGSRQHPTVTHAQSQP
jgi:hypothetical protein